MEQMIVGGGCFWGVEGAYKQIRGVESSLPAYAGGHEPKPTYQAVCSVNLTSRPRNSDRTGAPCKASASTLYKRPLAAILGVVVILDAEGRPTPAPLSTATRAGRTQGKKPVPPRTIVHRAVAHHLRFHNRAGADRCWDPMSRRSRNNRLRCLPRQGRFHRGSTARSTGSPCHPHR